MQFAPEPEDPRVFTGRLTSVHWSPAFAAALTKRCYRAFISTHGLSIMECFDYRDAEVVKAINKVASQTGTWAAYNCAGSDVSTDACSDER